MPLHKVPVGLWKQLRLWEGIYSRLPRHYLRSLEEARTPTPVHYRPHGAKFKINPKNWQRERVEDVPIPVHYPPESQLGLWGGEGWVLGHRYVNNDKVSEQDGLARYLPGLAARLRLGSGGTWRGRGLCTGGGLTARRTQLLSGWGGGLSLERGWGARPKETCRLHPHPHLS